MNQKHQQQPGQSGQSMAQPQRMAGRQGGTPMGRFFHTQNYLPEETRISSVGLLNQLLVDATVLQTHAKAAHWNAKGPNFYGLHELFEDIYEHLAEHADEIAERVTALGGEAKGTTRIAAASARIPGLPDGPVTGQEYVALLAERLAILDAHLGEGIRMASRQDDLDTADLLNDVSRKVTKDLWFLEAHLQTQPIEPSGGQGFEGPQQAGGGQQQAGGGPQGSGGGPQGFGGGQQGSSGGPQQSMGSAVGQSQHPQGQQPIGQQSMGQQPQGRQSMGHQSQGQGYGGAGGREFGGQHRHASGGGQYRPGGDPQQAGGPQQGGGSGQAGDPQQGGGSGQAGGGQ